MADDAKACVDANACIDDGLGAAETNSSEGSSYDTEETSTQPTRVTSKAGDDETSSMLQPFIFKVPSLTSIGLAARAPPPRSVYHALHSTFDQIRWLLPELRAAGFDGVQLPPAQASPPGDLRTQWYLRYQPMRFNCIDHILGGEEGLRKLCAEAERLGVAIVADCVFGHCAPVASREQWEAAQEDPALLEELTKRLDSTFAPEFSAADFALPWRAPPENDHFADCDAWPHGEWSRLKCTERVFQAQHAHLAQLLACGVRGFRLSGVERLPAERMQSHHDFLQSKGASFIYTQGAEVQHGRSAMRTMFSSSDEDIVPTLWMDYALAEQLAKAAKLHCPGLALPHLAAVESLVRSPAVRFVRTFDAAPGGDVDLCGWGGAANATERRMAWAYLLARPEGTVLVRDDDIDTPALRRAMAFRRAAVQHSARLLAAHPDFDVGEDEADPLRSAIGSVMTVELSAWPPPSFELVTLVLRAADGSLVGFAALNFGSVPSALHLPSELVPCMLQEVLAGPPPGAAFWEPELGEKCGGAEAMSQQVLPRDARFFLLSPATDVDLPTPDAEAMPGQCLELFYRSSWKAPRAYLSFDGAWTPSPGWPMQPFDLPDPEMNLPLAGPESPEGARWWTVQVPSSSKFASVEVAFNDGGEHWDRPQPSGAYLVEGHGAFMMQRGVVEKVPELHGHGVE